MYLWRGETDPGPLFASWWQPLLPFKLQLWFSFQTQWRLCSSLSKHHENLLTLIFFLILCIENSCSAQELWFLLLVTYKFPKASGGIGSKPVEPEGKFLTKEIVQTLKLCLSKHERLDKRDKNVRLLSILTEFIKKNSFFQGKLIIPPQKNKNKIAVQFYLVFRHKNM